METNGGNTGPMDNYDGIDAYKGWNLRMPKKLMKDREVHGVEYKMLRHDPVQAEWEIIGKLAAEPRQKPSIKMEAGESLTLMYYHQKMMKHPRKKGSCADWQNSEKDLQEENDRVEVIHENRNHREGQPTTIAEAWVPRCQGYCIKGWMHMDR